MVTAAQIYKNRTAPTVGDARLKSAPTVAKVVSAEGVLLEFRLSGVASRFFAFLIDAIIMSIAVSILNFVVILFAGLLTLIIGFDVFYSGFVGTMVILFLALFVYPTFCEKKWGGTPGKLTLSIKVISADGSRLTIGQSFIRALLFIPDFLFGLFLLLFSRNAQRLGDMLAGTLVVTKEFKHSQGFYFPPPYGFEQYANALDASRLKPNQYAVIRDFVLRAKDLSVNARIHLGQRLTDKVVETTTNEPLANMNSEQYLQSTVYAYQSKYYSL